MPAPTQVPVKPIVIKDLEVLFQLYDDEGELDPTIIDFRKHISQAQYDPSTTQASWQGGDPDETFTDESAPTFRLTLGYAQDWDTDDSLSQWLYENIGKRARIQCYPKRGMGKKGFASDIGIGTGALGGPVNSFATSTVSMGSSKPDIVTRAADPA